MKKPVRALLGLALTFGAMLGVASEVTVEEAPLTWRQAALSDGGELFNELCATCHGTSGKGDGPAAAALSKTVPDLTRLTVNNARIFPRERVTSAITGESRVVAHGTVDMPIWGKVFAELRPDQKPFRREAFARQQVYNLTVYLESIQDLSF